MSDTELSVLYWLIGDYSHEIHRVALYTMFAWGCVTKALQALQAWREAPDLSEPWRSDYLAI